MESTRNYNHLCPRLTNQMHLEVSCDFSTLIYCFLFLCPFSTPQFTNINLSRKSFSKYQKALSTTTPNSLEIKNLYKMVHFTLIPLFVWKSLQNLKVSSGYHRFSPLSSSIRALRTAQPFLLIKYSELFLYEPTYRLEHRSIICI